ncbi:hypothetical protein Tco_0176941 [Tanacetum coccineum]
MDDPIINYLERGVCPEDQNEARALQKKIGQYVMEEGVLFKKSYLMPMLRSVVAKAIRQRYNWPTMHRDAREEIRNLGNGCPRTAPRSHREGDVRNCGRGLMLQKSRVASWAVDHLLACNRSRHD